MSKFSTLNTAVSGLHAAQANLYVTGHNMANVNTLGYTRQQVIQNDSYYNNIGKFSAGTMQIGLGTNVAMIRQIRDKFLDASYRTSASKLGFYSTAYSVGLDIESIFGELEGEYKFQSVLTDLKNALYELSFDPTGVDTRGDFISTCITFIDKANDTYNSLLEQQQELNDNIIKMTARINELLDSINEYNRLISFNEAAGDNANDYRDMRENCLDELSTYLNITYKVRPDHSIDIHCEGNELLANGVVNRLGLRKASPNYNFVEVVFSSESGVMPYDATGESARLLFTYEKLLNSTVESSGMLKGLLVARGTRPASYVDTPGSLTPVSKPTDRTDPNYLTDLAAYNTYIKNKFNEEKALIPQAMYKLDTLFHAIVKLVNDAFSPTQLQSAGPPPVYEKADDYPYGLDGSQDFMPVFVRRGSAYRYDETTGTILGEDPDDYFSLFSIGNTFLNPALRNASNYKKLALSLSGDQSDMTLINGILKAWDSEFIGIDNEQKLNVSNFYKKIISDISIETSKYRTLADSETEALDSVDAKRLQVAGVALDEEMANMLRFQHAYNAAARLVNYIDSMIDRIINGTGRAGL